MFCSDLGETDSLVAAKESLFRFGIYYIKGVNRGLMRVQSAMDI